MFINIVPLPMQTYVLNFISYIENVQEVKRNVGQS